MGFQLPLVPYVVTHGPTLDPHSSLNQKNLSIVDDFLRRFKTDYIDYSERCSNSLYYVGERILHPVFETDKVYFPNLNRIMKQYREATIIMPTKRNYEILRDHADFGDIMQFMDSVAYPVIIAAEALPLFDSDGDFAVMNMVNRAFKLKVNMQKSVEQRRRKNYTNIMISRFGKY